MSERKNYALLIGAACLWSLKGILYKSIDWPPFVICAFRDLIAFTIYGIYRKSFKISLSKNIVIGALLSLSSQTIFTFANKLTLASNAIMLNYTNTAVIVFITWFVLKERITKQEMLSAVMVVIGVIIFFAGSIGGGHLLGDSLALLSGITVGTITVFDKKIPERPIDYYMLSCALSMTIGFSQAAISPVEYTRKSIVAVIILGALTTGCAGLLYAYAIKRVNQVKAAVILTIDPVLNTLIVAFAAKEIPEPLSLVGGMLVVASVGIACIPSNSSTQGENPRK